MSAQYQLGVIGAGNMAEGIVAAAVAQKLYSAGQIIVSDPVAERRSLFRDQFGTSVTEDNGEVVTQSAVVMLAIKPQVFAEVAGAFADRITDDHVVISILAGLGTKKIEAAFPKARARVVRVMPNLPIRVGAGVAGLCGGQYASADDIAIAARLMDAGGSSVIVNDEALMDAVTAVSGSGPAYFYYFVEQIVAGGVACGLKEADAMRLAKYTCLGAAKMMLESNDPPAELRKKVTSKGGTTQAALEHMASVKVDEAIQGAIKAAFKRGQELGA
jgi:pyrroline-5-carboxylate reductase